MAERGEHVPARRGAVEHPVRRRHGADRGDAPDRRGADREGGRRLDVALLPIGHAPWWKPGFRRGHLSSDDALTLFERLGARYLIPYHWGTFNHVTSKAHDAIERLRSLVPHHARGSDVKIIEPGQTFELPGVGQA